MNRKEFLSLFEQGPVILDGATGSNLQAAGMPAGVCPEQWIMDHPETLLKLQTDYVTAGTTILYTPTFSGNRVKLREYGLQDDLHHINVTLAGLSRQAADTAKDRKVYLAGDLTMTGAMLAPMGEMTLPELIDIYKEQASALLDGGVDLFVVETMTSLAETRAAVIAIREICDLPIMATLTFEADGRTLFGTDPASGIVVLQSLGADAVGINCSTGPMQMIPLIEKMKEYAQVPIIAKPNAGMPELINGKTVYSMDPESFGRYAKELLDAGAMMLGGCCGTTPDHIRNLAEQVKLMGKKDIFISRKHAIASERCIREISIEDDFLVIGERINPTGKKALKQALKEKNYEYIEELAESQTEAGADILDLNVGTPGADEMEAMLACIEKTTSVSHLPLCIDTSRVDVMEAALRAYPGRAMINSISLESAKCQPLFKLASKYGAMCILLPLSDKGLPENNEEKHDNINKLVAKAESYGIPKEDLIVDALVTTVGANPHAALDVIETIRYCREDLGIATTIGLSNISFGLPERKYINAAFAAMTIESGLTMAIANPSGQMFMAICKGAAMLSARPGAGNSYLDRMKDVEGTDPVAEQDPAAKKTLLEEIFGLVVKGKESLVTGAIDQALLVGKSADQILNEALIPAINEVGRLFETGRYFLPQLIAGANAMKAGTDHLTPMLSKKEAGKKGVVIIATVEGDIHDIGKNLVAMMLSNYGYQVYDLGKDVPADKIIEKAAEKKADLIVLSALMTTTMMKMSESVSLRNEKGLKAKIMIGGAVTTSDFAEEIGADGYSGDAAAAVKLADRLLHDEMNH